MPWALPGVRAGVQALVLHFCVNVSLRGAGGVHVGGVEGVLGGGVSGVMCEIFFPFPISYSGKSQKLSLTRILSLGIQR